MSYLRHFKSDSYLTDMAQNPDEIAKLSDMLVEVGAMSLLEIGSRNGGSLWYLANVMPQGSRIVSIDSGTGMGGNNPGQLDSLIECTKELEKLGYDVHFLYGKSDNAKIISVARKLGPFNAVFIDGDHTYEGVKFDWNTYSEMATHVVALHDVSFQWDSNMKYPPDHVGVPKLWNKIVSSHPDAEVFFSEGSNKGIGVVRI